MIVSLPMLDSVVTERATDPVVEVDLEKETPKVLLCEEDHGEF